MSFCHHQWKEESSCSDGAVLIVGLTFRLGLRKNVDLASDCPCWAGKKRLSVTAHKTLPFPQPFSLLSVRKWHLYSPSIQQKAPPPHFILGRRSSKNNKQLNVAVGFGNDSSSELKDRPGYFLMNNNIYRRPFTLRCFTNYKHTLPYHRMGETANFRDSAGKIPQPAQCRKTPTCQIAKGKAALHAGRGCC